MMLRIRPDLVGEFRQIEPVAFGRAFAPAQRAWVTQDRTGPGHIGQPHLATAEKGETLFRALAADVVARVPLTNRARIRFIAEDVPALGYKVFEVTATRSPARVRPAAGMRH